MVKKQIRNKDISISISRESNTNDKYYVTIKNIKKLNEEINLTKKDKITFKKEFDAMTNYASVYKTEDTLSFTHNINRWKTSSKVINDISKHKDSYFYLDDSLEIITKQIFNVLDKYQIVYTYDKETLKQIDTKKINSIKNIYKKNEKYNNTMRDIYGTSTTPFNVNKYYKFNINEILKYLLK